jgi:hypothetical protein
MKIEAVDFFYRSTPEVTTEADGSQDALPCTNPSGDVDRLQAARPGAACAVSRNIV